MVPSLAESWDDRRRPALRYVFSVCANGLRWSDGVSLTRATTSSSGSSAFLDPQRPGSSARDLLRARERPGPICLGRTKRLGRASAVNALDDLTVEFRLRCAPPPYFLSVMNRPDSWTASLATRSSADGDEWTETGSQVVSGPVRDIAGA